MPVFAVNAASMSSSAFFIEAAANTVRILSSARAGEAADPHKIANAVNSRARRCIEALQALSRDALGAALDAGKAGYCAFLRGTLGRRGQFGLGWCGQRQRDPMRWQGGEFGTRGKLRAIGRGQRRTLAIKRPFEFVAAARLFRRP